MPSLSVVNLVRRFLEPWFLRPRIGRVKRQTPASKTKQPAGRRADAGWVALWGSAAVLFAVVGASSVYFTDAGLGSNVELAAQGTLLPPPGKVRTTASIPGRGEESPAIQIYPSIGGVEAEQARRRMEAELETLRHEVAALRRGLAILQEQQAIRREREGTDTPSTPPRAKESGGETEGKIESGDAAPDPVRAEPSDDARRVPHQEAARAASGDAAKIAGTPRKPVETLPAPAPWRNEQPALETLAAEGDADTKLIEAALAKGTAAPVRIVALPTSEAPASVASIPAQSRSREPEVLQVTRAAGNLDEASRGRLGRTDFAIDLGRFDGEAAADEAWTRIRAAQTLLPTSIAHSKLSGPDGGVRLLAGPFHNAADAAAACVYLAAEAVTCSAVPYPQQRAAGG
jgi:hypothetical protein